MSELIKQLKDKKSQKRRSAAKKIRKLGDPKYGSLVLDALIQEVKDPRTWETQYQMIMALGSCHYVESLSFLNDFSQQNIEANMVKVALGDAIYRLSNFDDNIIRLFIAENRRDLFTGAIRALAMERESPAQEVISEIITYVLEFGLDDEILFWPLAAAPGWKGKIVKNFIESCLMSKREDVKSAAEFALEGKYRKWNPL